MGERPCFGGGYLPVDARGRPLLIYPEKVPEEFYFQKLNLLAWEFLFHENFGVWMDLLRKRMPAESLVDGRYGGVEINGVYYSLSRFSDVFQYVFEPSSSLAPSIALDSRRGVRVTLERKKGSESLKRVEWYKTNGEASLFETTLKFPRREFDLGNPTLNQKKFLVVQMLVDCQKGELRVGTCGEESRGNFWLERYKIVQDLGSYIRVKPEESQINLLGENPKLREIGRGLLFAYGPLVTGCPIKEVTETGSSLSLELVKEGERIRKNRLPKEAERNLRESLEKMWGQVRERYTDTLAVEIILPENIYMPKEHEGANLCVMFDPLSGRCKNLSLVRRNTVSGYSRQSMSLRPFLFDENEGFSANWGLEKVFPLLEVFYSALIKGPQVIVSVAISNSEQSLGNPRYKFQLSPIVLKRFF